MEKGRIAETGLVDSTVDSQSRCVNNSRAGSAGPSRQRDIRTSSRSEFRSARTLGRPSDETSLEISPEKRDKGEARSRRITRHAAQMPVTHDPRGRGSPTAAARAKKLSLEPSIQRTVQMTPSFPYAESRGPPGVYGRTQNSEHR